MILSLSWQIRRLLEKLGVSDWKAFTVENKILKIEEWIKRKHITNLMITFDPTMDNQYHTYSASLESFKLAHVDGIWQKHFTFVAKANIVEEKEA